MENHQQAIQAMRHDDAAHEIPLYEGEPNELYAFLNMCNQYLNFHGNTQHSVAKILGRLRGKAQRAISTINHEYKWNTISTYLINELDDKKTVNMMMDEMENLPRKCNSFADLIEAVKNQLYSIRMKYISNPEGIESIVDCHNQNAMHIISKRLPSSIRQQLILNPIPFHVFCNKIRALENSGELNFNYKENKNQPPKPFANRPEYHVKQHYQTQPFRIKLANAAAL